MPWQWNTQVMQQFEHSGAMALLRVATHVADTHRNNLGTLSPRKGKVYTSPSRRGEYPKKRTGHGQASVALDATTPAAIQAAGLKVRVGVRQIIQAPWLNYLAILEAKGWKGLVDTYEQVKGDLPRIARG